MTTSWDAARYDRVSAPQQRWGTDVVSRLTVRGHEQVLDAGCGSGRVTELLVRRVPSGAVVGLDASYDMAGLTHERVGVPVVVADLSVTLPFTTASFDAVLSTATFHWVRDQQVLYRELARVLRQDGQLVAQCGGAGNIARVLAALRDVGAADLHPWVFATSDEAVKLLKSSGFRDIDAWLHDEPTQFASREELGAFLSTCVLNPWLERLPVADRASFVDAVVARLPDLEVDYVRLNLVARR